MTKIETALFPSDDWDCAWAADLRPHQVYMSPDMEEPETPGQWLAARGSLLVPPVSCTNTSIFLCAEM